MPDYLNYKSVIAPYIKSFVESKTRKGIKGEDIKWTLYELDRYLAGKNHQACHIDKISYDGWYHAACDTRKASTVYHKVSVIRRFLLYMSNMGLECYIPRLQRKHKSDYVPYIFTEEEISRLFMAADNLREKEHHAKSLLMVIPVLLRTLYSTAIRISEAMNLRNKNIDFERHVIVLDKTKNGRQRLAPLNVSLERGLRKYIHYRNMLPVRGIKEPESYLFINGLGHKLTKTTLGRYFRRLLQEANIPYKGHEEGPSLHNLRHTACVHSFVRMHRQGRDIYCCLPILSTFMGHVKVLDTEYYLRLTQNMYPEIIQMDASVTAGLGRLIAKSLVKSDSHGDI
jgi:site-specific recombinase XerD